MLLSFKAGSFEVLTVIIPNKFSAPSSNCCFIHEKSIKNPTDCITSISSLSAQHRETVWILCHPLLLVACHPLFKKKSVQPNNSKEQQLWLSIFLSLSPLLSFYVSLNLARLQHAGTFLQTNCSPKATFQIQEHHSTYSL